MPILLSDLKNRTKKIVVEYQGDSLDVQYFINAVTPAFLSERLVIDQVKAVVAEWDVLDDEGKPIPVEDCVNSLPIEFLRSIVDAIVTDVRGGFDDNEKKD